VARHRAGSPPDLGAAAVRGDLATIGPVETAVIRLLKRHK